MEVETKFLFFFLSTMLALALIGQGYVILQLLQKNAALQIEVKRAISIAEQAEKTATSCGDKLDVVGDDLGKFMGSIRLCLDLQETKSRM